MYVFVFFLVFLLHDASNVADIGTIVGNRRRIGVMAPNGEIIG